jgi:mono/diheme cytochrome c family protein
MAPTVAAAPAGDPAQGQALYAAKTCSACHGAGAEGVVGPKLAGTALTFEQILMQVRAGKAPMPAFPPDQVSDQEVAHILAWLQSLR